MTTPFNFSPRENDFASKRRKTVLYHAGTTCCCCCCIHWLGAAIGGVTGYRSGWKKAEKKYGSVNRAFRKKVAWATAAGCLLGALFLLACAPLGRDGEKIILAFGFVPILFLLFPAVVAIFVSKSFKPKSSDNGDDEMESSAPTAWLPCLWMFIHATIGTILGYLIMWLAALM